MKSLEELEMSWNEFCKMTFPENFAGKEISGVCVVSLDSFAAGCIDQYFSNKVILDQSRLEILRQSEKELKIVLKNLEGFEKQYFKKLLDIVTKIVGLS